MNEEIQTWYCETCGRTMSVVLFYQSNNEEKYPNRYMNRCKKCQTMLVDNWNPSTYLPILEDIDVPYVPEEWNKLLTRYGKDRRKLTGTSIIGRYLSVMKLQQYRDFRWKDTEFLQDMQNNKIEQAMKRQGFDAAQIAEAIQKATFTMPAGPAGNTVTQPIQEDPDQIFGIKPSIQIEEEEDSVASQLTDEDKQYLRLKWGKMYKPEEWVWLENLYNEMLQSYDIQTAGHLDTLKLICKTSLKSNQLLDIGDIDGSQKAVKMYDSLMKSGKFTAAQNKAENGEFVDSIGELVAICETDGFIPRFYIDQPNDKVDRVLQDMQGYTKDLIFNEMNLGNLIENAVKGIAQQKEKEAEMDTGTAGDEDDLLEQELFEKQEDKYITDEDFDEFSGFEDELESADDEYLKTLMDKGEIDNGTQ